MLAPFNFTNQMAHMSFWKNIAYNK